METGLWETPDDWLLLFYTHFCAHGGLKVAFKGNEVKSKMKQPSDMPTPRFKHGGSDLWSSTLPLDHWGTLERHLVNSLKTNSNTTTSPTNTLATHKIICYKRVPMYLLCTKYVLNINTTVLVYDVRAIVFVF